MPVSAYPAPTRLRVPARRCSPFCRRTPLPGAHRDLGQSRRSTAGLARVSMGFSSRGAEGKAGQRSRKSFFYAGGEKVTAVLG